MISLSICTALAAIVIWLWLGRSISKKLSGVVSRMESSSLQVNAASQMVASNSQMLSESASDLAVSLETAATALEEMATGTKLNADNAGQADRLMKEANQVVMKTDIQMTALTQSMAEISAASLETSKIIKTIDEIAFQTNLLALNASVEAARAG